MKTKLEKALDEIQEEELRKRNKKKLNIKKEKNLQYYSNWNKDDREISEINNEKKTKQSKLRNFS